MTHPDRRPASVWTRRALVAAVLILVCGLGAYHFRTAPLGPPPQTAYTVNGDTVELDPHSPTWGYLSLMKAEAGAPLTAEPVPGRVAFDESRAAPIIAPMQGRVDNVAVRLGQRVEAGEHLLSIRSTAFVDLLQEIDQLKASEATRVKTVERLRALVQLKAAADKDLQSAELELHEARLAREGSELKLRSRPIVATGDGSYWLNAPRSGVVVQRDVLVGQEVGPDRSTPLLVVAELDQVIVTADVPESDVAWVHTGTAARVMSPVLKDRGLDGEVEYVGEVVDPVKRMINVRVRVENLDHSLRPNAFVQVTFNPGDKPTLVIPAEAVVTDDQRSFVFVQTNEQPPRLLRRTVLTGRQQAGKIEIADGLSAGETFVSRGAILLLNAVELAQ
ncbi:MAG: efflux RND transporter periplasmic adaptor subunit [Deltaproteobacteria bacterium]|nr:efflux RND transporter periplasmic adaptor subunit [Deltaproteobacteria bacterium]